MSLFGSVGSVQSSDFSHGLFKVSSPPGGFTFSGTVNKFGIAPQWTFGTYSFSSGFTVNVFLPGDQEYDLRLSIIDPSQTTGTIVMTSEGLTGIADMRDFEESVGVNLSGNPIQEIRFPDTDRDFSVNMRDCDIQGVVDMSMVTNLSGFCRFASNPGLTGIYHTFSSRPITIYGLDNCGLVGELVLPFTDIGGDFRVSSNPNLNKITHSPTDRQFTIYYASVADLQGVHDMSMITKFPNFFRIGANIGLTGLSHTYSNSIISEYWANSCGLEGVLDLTMFPNLKGGFFVSGNPGLTGIYHTTSNQVFDYYFANVCDLTGTLDLSMFPNFGGEIRLQTNPNLTEITHTFSAVNFQGYNASGCSLTNPRVDMLSNLTTADVGVMLWNWSNNNMGVTAVNQLLVDIDTVSVTASVTKTINVAGTNAAPTSGPPDGSTAVSNLLSKGYTVITS